MAQERATGKQRAALPPSFRTVFRDPGRSRWRLAAAPGTDRRMSGSDDTCSLAQRRILWWMAETGERPYWISARASWEGGARSTRCPLGLGRPHLPRRSVWALLDRGLLTVEEAPAPDGVVALPIRNPFPTRELLVASLRSPRQAIRPPCDRLALTDRGRAAAPALPPYPWRPNVDGLQDLTLSEAERQSKIAARAGAPAPVATEAGNVVVAAFGRRRAAL